MASPDVVSMIRFKNITAHLSDTEMDKFMSRLWRNVGRHRVLQFLCTSLPNIINNQEYSDLLPTASGIDEQTHLITLTDLPSCLIGEIASNSDLSEYITFSWTNRKLFVHSNSPNRLKRMDLAQGQYNYMGLRMGYFRQIEHLSLRLNQITELQRNDQNHQIFEMNNRLKMMLIACTDVQNSDIDCLIHDQSPCLRLFETLVLTSIGGTTLDSGRFFRLSGKFHGLKTFNW